VCNYARHTTYQVNPRTRDLIALCGVALAIEGPRMVRVSARRKAEKAADRVNAAARAQANGNVVDIGRGA
jgi:hypothetical protein